MGRIDHVENRLIGIKSRELYEAPAATLLHLAHHELETLCLSKQAARFKTLVSQEYADLISTYVLEGQQSKLSQAALETLAVVAYTQPISRARVSAVRGVNVDGVMRTLLARGLIEEVGHDHESGAVLFATTSYFLERMGLKTLDELPALAPQLPEVEELEAELGQLAEAAAGSPQPDSQTVEAPPDTAHEPPQ